MWAVWLWYLTPIVLVLLSLGIGGALAWRDPWVRAFIEDLEELGWRRSLRAVWGLVRDPRVPWFVRLLPVPLLMYLASPIDIIPDFIPVLGQLDDLLIVAGALWIVLRFTSRAVIAEHFAITPQRP